MKGINTIVLACLGATFFLRLGYGLAFPPQKAGEPLANPDHYVSLASGIADTGSLLSIEGKPSAEREPLFPLVLGLAFKLLGKHYWVALLVNAAAGTAALLLLHRVGLRLFGERAALWALALGAVYPQFLFYAAQPLRETFMTMMGLAAVCAAMEAAKRATVRAAAGAGLVNGLAGLTNTTFLPFALILAPLTSLFFTRRPKSSVVYLCVLAAVYSLWPIRNQLVFHRAIIGSTAGAASTFYAYLTVPQELGGTPEQDEIHAKDPIMAKAKGLDPVALEQYYWKQSLHWVKEHPLAYVRLVSWRFFWDMWRLVPRPRAYAHSYRKVWLASVLTDGWIIPLAFVGMVLFRFRNPEIVWAHLFVFSVSFTYSLIFTMLRYRISLMPWMILFAAFTLERAASRFLGNGPGRPEPVLQ